MYITNTFDGLPSLDGVPLNIEVNEAHPLVYRNRGSSETLEDYCKYVFQQVAIENTLIASFKNGNFEKAYNNS